jgi:hypothetical protein
MSTIEIDASDGLTMQRTETQGVTRGAVLSACGRYRYLLTRRWSDLPVLVFIMLNPSTADGLVDDATIRSCMRLARKLGRGGIVVVNLFALRSTDPLGLKGDPDPIGPRNDEVIRKVVEFSDVVVAWGSHRKIAGMVEARSAAVLTELFKPVASETAVFCFGRNGDEQPRHPLYIPTEMKLVPFGCACCSHDAHDDDGGCVCAEWCPNS